MSNAGLLVGSLFSVFQVSGPAPEGQPPPYLRIQVEHKLEVTRLPSGAKKVQIWFWLPLEVPEQRVLDLNVLFDAQKMKCRAVTDCAGNRYLAAEVEAPSDHEYRLSTRFDLIRNRVEFHLPPDRSAALGRHSRTLFGDYLDTSAASGFPITPKTEKWCSDNLSTGKNPVRVMRQIYDCVVLNTKHYANPEAKGIASSVADNAHPKEGVIYLVDSGLKSARPNEHVLYPKAGSAECVLQQGGGGCTDQHSLIIAAARLRGIPARLQLGVRLGEENREVTAGYRCVVEYFIPGYGWVPMDASQGGNEAARLKKQGESQSTIERARNFYFSGLDSQRIAFYRGRNLPLTTYDGVKTQPVNLFLHSYVLVDGQPHTQVRTTLTYRRVD